MHGLKVNISICDINKNINLRKLQFVDLYFIIAENARCKKQNIREFLTEHPMVMFHCTKIILSAIFFVLASFFLHATKLVDISSKKHKFNACSKA
jgi:hypothetical protein